MTLNSAHPSRRTPRQINLTVTSDVTLADDVSSLQRESRARRVRTRTNLGGKSVTKGRSKSCLHLGEARAEEIAVCNYWRDKWVSGTVTIPDRSKRMRRITLSKPVIPKGIVSPFVELRVTHSCD